MTYGKYRYGQVAYGGGRYERDLPAPPGFRVAYDIDGSLVLVVNGGLFDELTPTQIVDLNDEEHDAINPDAVLGLDNSSLIFVFPYLYDLTAIFIAATGVIPGSIEISDDTTNGFDGAWTTLTAEWTRYDRAIPDYRFVVPNEVNEVKGVRIHQDADGTPAFHAIHFYSGGSNNPHRLLPYHPTNNEAVGSDWFNFGYAQEEFDYYQTFRIFNDSPTATFHSLAITPETLSEIGEEVDYFITDGSTLYTSYNIGDLAPKQASEVITLVMSVPAGVTRSPRAFRLRVEPDSGPSQEYVEPQISFMASERIATTTYNGYEHNRPIAVGPDPTDLFVCGDSGETRVRQMHEDGTHTVLGAYTHGSYQGVMAHRGSVRHALGEVAWLALEGSSLRGYRYSGGVVERSPELVLSVAPSARPSVISDGSDTAFVLSAFGGGVSTTGTRISKVTWDGDTANAPVEVETVDLTSAGEPGQFGSIQMVEFGSDWYWVLKDSDNGNQRVLRTFAFPDIPDNVGGTVVTPNWLGAGWLSEVVTGDPEGSAIAMNSVLDPTVVVDTTDPLPDDSGFGSYYDGGLVRTHEWDPGTVVSWGAGEFSNSGEFVPGSGENLSGGHIVAYLNGEPFFHHRLSFNAYLYPQHFFVGRPLRIGDQVWGLVCYDDYAGGAANDDSFIQAFGYTLP